MCDPIACKARLYELQNEIAEQTGKTRQAAIAAAKTTQVWFEWRGDGFDLINISQGIIRAKEALETLDYEHRRLLALLAEQGGLKKEIP